jgi:hypothetical protein
MSMNKPALFFAGTTGLFALSTLYFAWQLNSRDAELAADAAMVGQTMPASPVNAGTVTAPVGSATTIGAAGAPAPGGAPQAATAPAGGSTAAAAGADKRRSMITPFATDFLRQYDNLTLRDALMAQARRGFESQYAALRDRLKLDAATFDQLVSLLAEEQLDQQANYFRCVVDPACDLDKVPTPRMRSDEFLALLGPEGNTEFLDYRDAMPEWQSVVQLRGRLSESQSLRDSDAQRLQAALTESRKRFADDLQQQGAKLQGWGNGSGTLWYSGDGTVEQRLASATQFSQTLRRQAATMLNAEQLRLFAQVQDELLAGFAAWLQQDQGQGN